MRATRVSTGGAAVFAAAVAAKKVVTISASTTPELGAKLSPYLWNYGADPQAGSPLAAAFAGKSLAGEKAQWAGDTALQSKKRAFGVVYPTAGFDVDAFEKSMKSNGATVTQAVGFDPTDPTTYAQQVPFEELPESYREWFPRLDTRDDGDYLVNPRVGARGMAGMAPPAATKLEGNALMWEAVGAVEASRASFEPAEVLADYLKRQAHATFMWDPLAIEVRHLTGTDCLLWGNDYPHPEGSFLFSREWNDKQFAGVPDDEIDALVCGNAAKLFNIRV